MAPGVSARSSFCFSERKPRPRGTRFDCGSAPRSQGLAQVGVAFLGRADCRTGRRPSVGAVGQPGSSALRPGVPSLPDRRDFPSFHPGVPGPAVKFFECAMLLRADSVWHSMKLVTSAERQPPIYYRDAWKSLRRVRGGFCGSKRGGGNASCSGAVGETRRSSANGCQGHRGEESARWPGPGTSPSASLGQTASGDRRGDRDSPSSRAQPNRSTSLKVIQHGADGEGFWRTARCHDSAGSGVHATADPFPHRSAGWWVGGAGRFDAHLGSASGSSWPWVWHAAHRGSACRSVCTACSVDATAGCSGRRARSIPAAAGRDPGHWHGIQRANAGTTAPIGAFQLGPFA